MNDKALETDGSLLYIEADITKTGDFVECE